jgi:hypothetical protein
MVLISLWVNSSSIGGVMGVKAIALWGVGVVAVSAWLCADAAAMSAFSRKYGMQCDGCHSKIPKLNDFGTAFLKNGFVLPSDMRPPVSMGSKQDREIDPGASTASKNEPREVPEGEDPVPKGTDHGDSDLSLGPPTELKAEEPPPPPPPPMVLYKLKSRDGSLYFTDSPRPGLSVQEPAGKPSRRALTKPPAKKVPELKSSVARRRSSGGPDAARNTEEASPPGHRNYAECMEHQLVDAPQPESAREMMELLVEAERTCIGYQ